MTPSFKNKAELFPNQVISIVCEHLGESMFGTLEEMSV